MPSEVKLSVTLTDEIVATIGRAVECGHYAGANEVIREALVAWMIKRGAAEQERTLLRDVIARSITSGNVGEVTAETLKLEGRALLAARGKPEKA